MANLVVQDGFGPHELRRPAVVAGASSGIGAAVAESLAAAGHPVALGARRVERCEQVARRIRDAGGEATAAPLDVADDASVAAFAKLVADAYGDVDVVVANAGGMSPGTVLDVGVDTVRRELETNTLGALRVVQAFGPAMVERGHGDLVLVSSDVVADPRPVLGSYNASKSAAEALFRTLQAELEGSGVRASIVRPGATATDVAAGWDDRDAVAVFEAARRSGLLRHLGFLDPSAIAATVTHVVSAPRGVHIALTTVAPEAPPARAGQR